MRPHALGGGAAIAALCAFLGACGGCSKRGEPNDAPGEAASAAAEEAPADAGAEGRCRAGEGRLALSGEDVVVGEAAVGPGGLLVGLVRTEQGRRAAGVIRASTELGTSEWIELGIAHGDDPPPTPRYRGASAYAAHLARASGDGGGAMPRELRLMRLDDGGGAKLEATVLQPGGGEPSAFDWAWSEGGAAIAAWDEDAPKGAAGSPARGLVKVQLLRDGARARVASPVGSDAEAPRLLARSNGGFWLAWLARRVEHREYAVEGPAEAPAFRWVELVALSAGGEVEGPVRRVSDAAGRAASFELAHRGSELVVFVQDEAASAEGAGARIARYVVGDAGAPIDVVEGGIDQGLADFVPIGGGPGGARWIAWTDSAERARLVLLDPGLAPVGEPTTEPLLDGARVLAALPDAVYALTGAAPAADQPERRPALPTPELSRFACETGLGSAR